MILLTAFTNVVVVAAAPTASFYASTIVSYVDVIIEVVREREILCMVVCMRDS